MKHLNFSFYNTKHLNLSRGRLAQGRHQESGSQALLFSVFSVYKSLSVKITTFADAVYAWDCVIKVYQVGQKQSSQTRIPNAPSSLPMASKEQPMESRKTQLWPSIHPFIPRHACIHSLVRSFIHLLMGILHGVFCILSSYSVFFSF